jgi:rhamnose transport system substrate-binding protein
MKHLFTLGLALLVLLAGCGAPQDNTEPAEPGTESASAPADGKTFKIGVMPKLIGIPFFNAAHEGVKQAAAELGIEVDYDGPVAGEGVEKQAQMIDTWIARKYDAIAVAPNDPEAIAPVLEKARKRGIKVLTWDADARAETRDLFINQCTAESVARTLVDLLAKNIGPEAKYAIVTGTLTAANQNVWMAEIEKYRAASFPGMVNLTPTPVAPGEDKARATQMTMDTIKSQPDLQGILAITSVALPGGAEALRKTNEASRVFLTGLATPNDMKEYIADGTVKEFVLWNVVDLGYLTVHAAHALLEGTVAPGDTEMTAGRLGTVQIDGDQVILGDPLVFDASNVNDFDF